MQGGDQMCKADHATHNIGVLRISKMSDGYRRFRRRDQNQIVPLEFAPADRIVVVAQFHKINRTIEFRAPAERLNLAHVRINLYEGTRPQQRPISVFTVGDCLVGPEAYVSTDAL